MQHTRAMLDSHPLHALVDRALLAECIDACSDCAQVCTACADACLGEQTVAELVRCIRINLDCSSVCAATGSLVSRQTEPDIELLCTQLGACQAACRVCAEECRGHAKHHEHCRVCAEACRRCEEACERVAAALAAQSSARGIVSPAAA
jgi:hypothetical protein